MDMTDGVGGASSRNTSPGYSTAAISEKIRLMRCSGVVMDTYPASISFIILERLVPLRYASLSISATTRSDSTTE